MEHRRLSWVLPVIAAVMVACGSAAIGNTTSTTSLETAGSEAVASTIEATTPTTIIDVAETTTTTLSDRPIAPDFTLDLGEGGTFTLSDSDKPVYLVFWAEW